MQINGGNARLGESLCQLLGVVLSAHEKDSTSSSGGQCVDEVLFRLNAGGLEHVVGHLDDGRVLLVHRVHDLVVEETLHQLVHTVIQCCREQQTLAGGRGRLEDLGDDGQKAQVRHVVGFIQHGDFNGV